jgi:hypothetical protein
MSAVTGIAKFATAVGVGVIAHVLVDKAQTKRSSRKTAKTAA